MYHFSKAEFKRYAPFTQLPLYHGDGVLAAGQVLCQSRAICRHIARTHGMFGDGDAEAAQIDMFFELHKDLARVHALNPEALAATRRAKPRSPTSRLRKWPMCRRVCRVCAVTA